MLIFENIKLALSAIRSNKMRSFLTMLGIIIGISSVIAITAIGDGAKAVVAKQMDTFGTNFMYIYVNWQLTEGYVEYSDLISLDEIEALKARFPDELVYAAPSVYARTDTSVGNSKAEFDIQGADNGLDKFKNLNMIHGRMVSESDVKGKRDVIIIDKKAAMHLFNRSNVLGETLTFEINDEVKDLTIIGVYELEESMFAQMSGNSRYLAYVPYSLILYGDSEATIEVFLSEDANMSYTPKALADYLTKIKKKQENFYIADTAQGHQAMMDQMIGSLSMAVGAIAAISLVVGGIGIMNIMLVSVTERTREIGIRKSLGARTGDILQQFLVEAMILSAIGGLIGTGLGLGIGAIGMSLVGVDMQVNPMVVLIAVGFSAIVGMFFGWYPARKAAKMDPIDALRYE